MPSGEPRLALMERVRAERRGALLALKAEGHYLQVHTDAGSDLILYRLSDALLEVGAEDGAQVHRSWWVAARALSGQRHRDRLILVNGIEVPVSRSFCVGARQRGWLSTPDARDG
jgi:DNA-binding LytR/AlgR family response regulator